MCDIVCVCKLIMNVILTRIWADAQPDGRPAECMWRPLLNAVDQMAKTTKPRQGKLLKFAEVPQTPQPISVISGPKYTIL